MNIYVDQAIGCRDARMQPTNGDVKLALRLAPYRGPKGNFKFPLEQPIPYDLIKDVINARIKEHREHLAAKSVKK